MTSQDSGFSGTRERQRCAQLDLVALHTSKLTERDLFVVTSQDSGFSELRRRQKSCTVWT